jgi:carbamoyl-phosphate synthase small subunit
MSEYGIVGISGVDTRCLARKLRNEGSQKGIITSSDVSTQEALKRLERPLPRNAVSCVSTRKKWFSRTAHAKFDVVAVDCGIKLNIVRCLNARGCNVTVVPFDTAAEEIAALSPDGVFFSNGPGDPSDVPETAELLKKIRGRYPVFGICLGHQLAGLAYGAKTFKLKFGHRGGNHPVRNLETGRLEITSQNHSYAIDRDSLSGTGLKVTHENLLDGTVEGMECVKDRLFTVQFHPESAPGPQDSGYLFDKFVRLMAANKKD